MLKLLRDIARLFGHDERRRIVTLVVLMITSAFVEAAGIGLLMPYVAMVGNLDVIHDDARLAAVYRWTGATSEVTFLQLASGVLIAMFLAKNAFLGWTNYLQNRFLYAKEAALTTRLVEAYLYAPYTYHLQRNSTELVRIATSEVPRVISGVVVPIFTLMAESFVVALMTVLLLMAAPVAGVIAIGGVLLVAVVAQRYFRPRMVRVRDVRIKHQASQVRWAAQALGALRDVKVLRRENYFVGQVEKASIDSSKSTVFFTTLNGLPRLVLETIAVMCIAGFVIVAVANGAALGPILPMLALFAMVAIRIMPSATKMMNAINVIRFFRPGLDAVLSSLNAAPKSSLQLAIQRNGTPPHQEAHHFEQFRLHDVWYRHPEMHDWILQGVNCTICRGDFLAVVGRSGSGKSTLADLLLGLISPQKGRVEVDGTAIADLGDRWLSLVGYVPQNAYLLDDTIRRNVAFGIPDGGIDDALVWRALNSAQLGNKVQTLPETLNFVIGESGSHLSGGERQRLAVARALYHDPDILVFDEATSALDVQTGCDLMGVIEALAGSKTIVFITHHLESIAHLKKVIYMEAGRVVAHGTFDQLRPLIWDRNSPTNNSESRAPGRSC